MVEKSFNGRNDGCGDDITTIVFTDELDNRLLTSVAETRLSELVDTSVTAATFDVTRSDTVKEKGYGLTIIEFFVNGATSGDSGR